MSVGLSSDTRKTKNVYRKAIEFSPMQVVTFNILLDSVVKKKMEQALYFSER